MKYYSSTDQEDYDKQKDIKRDYLRIITAIILYPFIS